MKLLKPVTAPVEPITEYFQLDTKLVCRLVPGYRLLAGFTPQNQTSLIKTCRSDTFYFLQENARHPNYYYYYYFQKLILKLYVTITCM
jgi:hypothetical protein